MQNLSHFAAGSPWVTSEEGGNLVHDNSAAMTAPGSVPATPLPPVEQQADPAVTPIGHARTVMLPDGPRSGPPSPVPWTASDGSAWKSSADDEYLPRIQLQRGEWNEL
jgi:hypothetical protein